MERRNFLFLVFFAFVTTAVFGQILDKPAATVNLYKPEIITVKQLDQRIQQLQMYAQGGLDRKKVLDDLISETLIRQAAIQEGVIATDNEVIGAIRQTLGQQGASVNDDQLKLLVAQQTGVSWDLYLKQAKQQLAMNNYIKMKKGSEFQNIKAPSEKEVNDIFNENSHLFLNPEMVRFSQIYRDTRNLSLDEKKEARSIIEGVSRDLKNRAATFDELVVKYSDDTQSRYHGGDVGYLQRNDANSQSLLGRNFFDTVFTLKVGQTSEVLESNIGFHIIKVTEKLPKKFLDLDDAVSPMSNETVRDRIIALKIQEKQQQILQKAVGEIVGDLKKNAEIVIYDNNL